MYNTTTTYTHTHIQQYNETNDFNLQTTPAIKINQGNHRVKGLII